MKKLNSIVNFKFLHFIGFIVLVELSINYVDGIPTYVGQPKVPGADGNPPESIWDQKVNIPLWGRLLIAAGGIFLAVLLCCCWVKFCGSGCPDEGTCFCLEILVSILRKLCG